MLNSAMTVLSLTMKGQKVGGGPVPGNPHPFFKTIGIIIPVFSPLNYLAHKN